MLAGHACMLAAAEGGKRRLPVASFRRAPAPLQAWIAPPAPNPYGLFISTAALDVDPGIADPNFVDPNAQTEVRTCASVGAVGCLGAGPAAPALTGRGSTPQPGKARWQPTRNAAPCTGKGRRLCLSARRLAAAPCTQSTPLPLPGLSHCRVSRPA